MWYCHLWIPEVKLFEQTQGILRYIYWKKPTEKPQQEFRITMILV